MLPLPLRRATGSRCGIGRHCGIGRRVAALTVLGTALASGVVSNAAVAQSQAGQGAGKTLAETIAESAKDPAAKAPSGKPAAVKTNPLRSAATKVEVPKAGNTPGDPKAGAGQATMTRVNAPATAASPGADTKLARPATIKTGEAKTGEPKPATVRPAIAKPEVAKVPAAQPVTTIGSGAAGAAAILGTAGAAPAGTTPASPGVNPVTTTGALPAATPIGKATGLPVPRYASLKTDRVNLREGPSKDNRTAWVFQRAGLPVEIVAEYETWRRIRDAEGTEGWVLHSLLSGRRTALIMPWVKAGDPLPLYGKADDRSDVVARLQTNVIASVKQCVAEWCRVMVVQPGGSDLAGYIRQDRLWGVYPNEKVE